jgi:hypothetical protein
MPLGLAQLSAYGSHPQSPEIDPDLTGNRPVPAGYFRPGLSPVNLL